MNERIRELAKQCYETGPIGKDGWPEYSRLNEEKFAELIVRECVDKAERYGLGSDAVEQMKEDFGVEEE
jgi:hypothetical protein